MLSLSLRAIKGKAGKWEELSDNNRSHVHGPFPVAQTFASPPKEVGYSRTDAVESRDHMRNVDISYKKAAVLDLRQKSTSSLQRQSKVSPRGSVKVAGLWRWDADFPAK